MSVEFIPFQGFSRLQVLRCYIVRSLRRTISYSSLRHLIMRQIALFVFQSNNIVCIFQNKLISLQTLKGKIKRTVKIRETNRNS